MKKRFLLIPAIGLPLLTIIPTISSYSSVAQKTIGNKTNAIAQTDVNNYSVVTPELTHYKVGEKLDLRDLKVTYNDPEKGAIDVTSECELSMQNDQELVQEGEFDVTIQHNDFNTSFKIYVEKEPVEVPNTNNDAWFGDICVTFKLMSNQECILTGYKDGEGTLTIPDFVLRDNVKYFIKQIPTNWSNGENDITGLKFECKHLKKICYWAFNLTNCLDYYINNKYINGEPNLLKFPEGLEEIGSYVFSETDCGQHSIKGYSFPSTLKKIWRWAFAYCPYIDGEDDNGILEFRSVPEIESQAFYIPGVPEHDCKWIYGSSLDVAKDVHNKLCGSGDFNSSDDFLIPRLIGDDYYKTTEVKFGDITAKCGLIGDECWIISYISGKGIFKVLDHIEYDNRTFYIKEIPSNWSNGENDITGLEFADDVSHLKKICDNAFKNTNCLDYYINNKKELLQFPEGLEEIGDYAFYGTDYGQNKIKGYSFPSTLKKIGNKAFYKAPYIDGDNDNGELQFRSIPEIASDAFYIDGVPKHDCKYIYGSSVEIVNAVWNRLFESNCFNNLKPYLIGDNCQIAQFKWGDITVECSLIRDECTIMSYVSGSGTLVIPDHVDYNNRTYYIKSIPSNWSDGENDITGLKFADDVSHLKKICHNAFENTNCLDYYINRKDELLEFPEGLEEIADSAFYGTDYGQNKIKGYSFPSTLKKIGTNAFSKAPYINGDNDNGELHFKSVPEGLETFDIFNCTDVHKCKHIYASTYEMAMQIANIFRQKSCFYHDTFYLLPNAIEYNYENTKIIEEKFGDIVVKCYIHHDELRFLNYVSGSGTLTIPDHIVDCGNNYYIKEIPSDWSRGENNITGLKFADDVSHLKKICHNAFKNTNCLNYYINHKDELLEFPEGLEEIGDSAFSETGCGLSKIKGYSFPSTLKKIGTNAFSKAPYIDGKGDNGELHFKSIPEGLETFDIFNCTDVHKCKHIYASTYEMAMQIANIFRQKSCFCHDTFYLLPNAIEYNYENTKIIEEKFGDIVVKCYIHHDELRFLNYVSGSGTLTIPDHIVDCGNNYYIREIPSDWSRGENNITGLKFADDVSHLKKICDHAFEDTNCLDYYINHKDELLIFPEGLEEIGDSAFYGTDYGQNTIKGYSFPSTLKKIGSKAFSKAPYIDGDDDNGELQFRSIPEIASDAFYICGIPEHDCKFISGSTQEIAEQMVKLIKDNMSDDFSTGSDYLIPQVIKK